MILTESRVAYGPMTQDRTALPPDADYESIEAAVLQTARGRWFLAEYARRNRSADTELVLDAIARLEANLVGQSGTDAGRERLRSDLAAMARAIVRTRAEISALLPADRQAGVVAQATEALDAIVRTIEGATQDIGQAAERVQDAAWRLREGGASPALCDDLDRRAAEIYAACGVRDFTAERTRKLVHTLHFLEGRIAEMLGRPEVSEEAPPEPGFQEPYPAPSVEERLVLIEEEPRMRSGFAESRREQGAAPFPRRRSAAERLAALAEIDALDTREKLSRFT
jgi:hypothetical protein